MNLLALSFLFFSFAAADNALTEAIQNLFNNNKNREALVKDTVEKAFYANEQAYNVMVCTNYAYYM
jgi:hypothetical protein